MRKKIFLLTVSFGLFFSTVAFAHPPSDIKIKFDSATKILQAIIYHNTSNPQKHYINKVDVGLNGKEIISQVISREDDNLSQTVSYLIPDAKPGDLISVEGYCNISGNLTKEIKVTESSSK